MMLDEVEEAALFDAGVIGANARELAVAQAGEGDAGLRRQVRTTLREYARGRYDEAWFERSYWHDQFLQNHSHRCHLSLLLAAAKLGAHFVAGTPATHKPDQELLARADSLSKPRPPPAGPFGGITC